MPTRFSTCQISVAPSGAVMPVWSLVMVTTLVVTPHVLSYDLVLLGQIEPTKIVQKGRLQPGRMFLVDTKEGRIVEDDEIKRKLATAKPWREWVAGNQVPLDTLAGEVAELVARDGQETVDRAADGILRVDGGMTASDWAMQFLSDILGAPVDRPVVTETTALGAAYLAGLKAGLCPPPAEFQKSWALERRFTPAMDDRTRNAKYARWGRAVAATMTV